MRNRYLTNDEIREMAEAAFTNYEFSCEWSKAREAAIEFAVDEYGFRPGPSAIYLAVKIARVNWGTAVEQVKELNA